MQPGFSNRPAVPVPAFVNMLCRLILMFSFTVSCAAGYICPSRDSISQPWVSLLSQCVEREWIGSELD